MAKVVENAKKVNWLNLWKSQLCQMGKMFRVVKFDKKADLTKNTKVGKMGNMVKQQKRPK